MNNKIITSILLAYAVFAGSSIANADEVINPIPQVSDQWRFAISPYALIPNVSATINTGTVQKNAFLTMKDIITNMKSGAMILGEVHYGKWGFMTDAAFATLTRKGGFDIKGDSQLGVSDRATLKASLVTAAATYTIFNDQNTYVDALLGARWMSLTTTVKLAEDSGPLSIEPTSGMHTIDAVAGIKGMYRIMDSSWYIPFYADVGTGGGPTNTTWQVAAGIGKALSKSMDMSLTYRAISFDAHSGVDRSTLTKATFFGPQLTGTLHF